MTAYYNEHDPRAAEWLRTLILMGEIAEGIVDERSIEDVVPSDLDGFTQCHFFAGIGGWSLALRLSGVSDNTPVWTGSCPCQPFSAAGKGAGFADERHLGPAFLHLIRLGRPDIVFGEQVASNLAWLDLVQADLEGESYVLGAAIIGAHSVGAPHIRQRLYWMAESQSEQSHRYWNSRRWWRQPANVSVRILADADSERRQQITRSASSDEGAHGRRPNGNYVAPSDGEIYWLADANSERLQERSQPDGEPQPQPSREAAGTFWDNAGRCGPDAKGLYRPIEPGLVPLVDGLPGRVGLLRGYGNAIVPQAAAAFIKAYIGG